MSGIDLYTAGTPNGHKLSIALEELGVRYTAHHVDISKDEQKADWYLQINPNGRIPALVDHTVTPPQRIFEGGAMLLYLAARHDPKQVLGFAHDSAAYWESVEWVVWMQSGLGPMQGQANHFFRYAPEKIEYAIERYQGEVRRLYQVLEARLEAQEGRGQGLWVVGGKYSIADIACFSWVNWAEWAGVKTTPFPRVERWLGVINAREAVQRGVNVPEEFQLKKAMQTKEGEEALAKHHGSWVMKGQKEQQEKHR